MEFVKKLHPDPSYPGLLPDIKLATITGRAEALFDGTIKVTAKEAAESIAHEITHVVEYSDPATLGAARDFLRRRWHAGELPEFLQTIYPGHGYLDWEIAIQDDFAKLGGEAYAGKLYFPGVDVEAHRLQWLALLKTNPAQAFSQINATEILTMGMERLIKDPVAFHAEDADYFTTVVSTLQKLTP